MRYACRLSCSPHPYLLKALIGRSFCLSTDSFKQSPFRLRRRHAIRPQLGTKRSHWTSRPMRTLLPPPRGRAKPCLRSRSTCCSGRTLCHCHPELIETRVPKGIFPQQWHLKATTVGGLTINAHANVEAAHAITRGAGVTIAVIDDDVDIDHPEFGGSGKLVAPADATLQTDDPRPKLNAEKHGTACAGVASANGSDGASGVAPLARLLPIRLASDLGSIREAQAFRWAADHGADVISCSWGPADGRWFDPNDPLHTAPAPLPASTRDAIDYAVTQRPRRQRVRGRVCGREWERAVDLDGYASYEKVIAVAACNDRGNRSVYSDFGKAVWCVSRATTSATPRSTIPPLTPGSGRRIRLGPQGYNPGNPQFGDAAGKYTNSFGGTSMPARSCRGGRLGPVRQRVLRWNEVKDLLRQACDPDRSAGRPIRHRQRTRRRFVRARTVERRGRGQTGETIGGQVGSREQIAQRTNPGLGQSRGNGGCHGDDPVQKVAVYVRLRHTYIGDLVITVVPPAASALGSRPAQSIGRQPRRSRTAVRP